jgi:RNA polymerase sigma-70 factor (ECF subfamily)
MQYTQREEAYNAASFSEAAGAREHALVEAAKAGDAEAWERIWNEHYPTVLKYVRARVVDRETAEDLACSVFLEAMRGIRRYEERGRPLLAWLYTIARNLVAYHYRQGFRSPGRLAGAEPTPGLGAANHAAGEPLASADLLDLRAAVNSLPDEQREALTLRYLVGLTTPEVAAVLGKKDRAVYSLIGRALQSLRKKLQ